MENIKNFKQIKSPYSIKKRNIDFNFMKIKKYNYFIIAFLIIISGNPIFYKIVTKEFNYAVISFLSILFIIIFRTKIDIVAKRVVLMFLSIFALQIIQFGSVIINSYFGFLANMMFGLICFRYIANSSYIYIRVMTAISIISLIFYIPDIISGHYLRSVMSTISIDYGSAAVHIGLHNFNSEIDSHRNSGMFWEPGAFGGYLVVAILLTITSKRILISRSTILLIITTLTTQSSTSYIALILCLYILILQKFNRKEAIKYFVLISVFSIFALISSFTVPFLMEKVAFQYANAVALDEGYQLSRFGNALYDWNFIRSHPIVGWSTTPATRGLSPDEVSDFVAGQGNGLTGSVVRFGFLGVFTLFAAAFSAYYQYSGKLQIALMSCIILAVLLFGEQYLMFPLFFGFFFVNADKNLLLPNRQAAC
jgi:hypothetical protein